MSKRLVVTAQYAVVHIWGRQWLIAGWDWLGQGEAVQAEINAGCRSHSCAAVHCNFTRISTGAPSKRVTVQQQTGDDPAVAALKSCCSSGSIVRIGTTGAAGATSPPQKPLKPLIAGQWPARC